MNRQERQWLLVDKYQGQESEAYLSDVAKLEAGVPLAYLIGHIPFLNTTIYLDSHPLIPRPETEYWAEHAIKEMSAQSEQSSFRVLDLCAGSGALGVAVAHSLANALVDFIEIDPSHLPTIAKNSNANNIETSRVNIYAGDLFSTSHGNPLPKYDFILTNPPYIDKSLNRTTQSVIDNEPELALYGGKAGMEIIERIINEAPIHLKQCGQLWIEHEPEQAEAIFKLASQQFIVTTHQDQYRVKRYSQLVLQ